MSRRKLNQGDLILWKVSRLFTKREHTVDLATHLLFNVYPNGGAGFVSGLSVPGGVPDWKDGAHRAIMEWCKRKPEDAYGDNLLDILAVVYRDVAVQYCQELDPLGRSAFVRNPAASLPNYSQSDAPALESSAEGAATSSHQPIAPESTPPPQALLDVRGICFRAKTQLEKKNLDKLKGQLFRGIAKAYAQHWKAIIDCLVGVSERKVLESQSSGADAPPDKEDLLVNALTKWSESEEEPYGQELYDAIFQAVPDKFAIKKLRKHLKLPEDYEPAVTYDDLTL